MKYTHVAKPSQYNRRRCQTCTNGEAANSLTAKPYLDPQEQATLEGGRFSSSKSQPYFCQMDRFFRAEKPISRPLPPAKSLEKPGISEKPDTPAPPDISPAPDPPQKPALKEWPDIASDGAAAVDIAQLSNNEIEDILRLFDLNPAYGPFVGVDREFRWQRAFACGLDPPDIIRRILESGRAIEQRDAGSLW